MSEFTINADMFGRYVKIPTGFSGELHTYKVVGRFNSDGYCDVPIVYNTEMTVHPECVDVLNVIHCGVAEDKVIRVALKDCKLIPPHLEPFRYGPHEDSDLITRQAVYDMLNALGGCDACEEWAKGWDSAIDTAIKELDGIPAAVSLEDMASRITAAGQRMATAKPPHTYFKAVSVKKAVEIVRGGVNPTDEKEPC